MVGIGQHINLAFCKHSSSIARGCGAGPVRCRQMSHIDSSAKSNMQPDFLASDLHFLAVTLKRVNLRGQSNVSKQTNKCARLMKDTRFPAAGHRHEHDRICKCCRAFFFSARLIGKWWSKCCLALDRNSQHGRLPFSCTVSPLILTLEKRVVSVSIIDKSCLCLRRPPSLVNPSSSPPLTPVTASRMSSSSFKHNTTGTAKTHHIHPDASVYLTFVKTLLSGQLWARRLPSQSFVLMWNQWKCTVVKSRRKDINRKTLTFSTGHKTQPTLQGPVCKSL